MPELPDVEAFRHHLDATSLHRAIAEITVADERLLDHIAPGTFSHHLRDHELARTRRHGKYLFARTNGEWMVFHFGMTGYLRHLDPGEPLPPYAGILLDFRSGDRLAYGSRRRLGRVGLTPDPEQFVAEHALGPDALTITEAAFLELARTRHGGAKGWLMDQSIMAGIGNVYSDEILYQAGIHPRRRMDTLPDTDLKRLYRTMKEVLSTAIECEAEAQRLPADWLLTHRRYGEPCPRCRGRVERISLHGRSAYFCPGCQKP